MCNFSMATTILSPGLWCLLVNASNSDMAYRGKMSNTISHD